MTLEEFTREWNNPSPRLLVHTSGSTGRPKPIWVEKKRMEASALTTCRFLGLKEGDTALLCMPLDYIAGKMMVVRSIVAHLRLISVLPSGHPMGSLTESPTLAAMVPMQVYNTLASPRERELLKQTRHLLIGGGAIDDKMEAELKKFPHAVWCTYGMTETLSHIALRRINGPEASQWYTPLDHVEVGTNSEGSLIINAPDVCTSPLVTNDIAEIAPDGKRFRIKGRKDNVVCSGGIKIQIEEVERRLIPHISEPFMITKRPDEKFGEAIVMLTESRDINKIKDICDGVLPAYWLPKAYIHTDQLPITPTGKPARKAAQEFVLKHNS